jgi:biotin synthase
VFRLEDVIERLGVAVRGGFMRRVCIQALNYPGVFEDVLGIVTGIRSRVDVPVSLSCQPLGGEQVKALAEAGLDTIGIPVDAATEELFEEVKGAAVSGPYNWKRQIDALRSAVEVFGAGRVYTHLIVGLGETDEEMVHFIQEMVDMGVYPALFAFTPLPGTMLEGRAQPELSRYRRLQLAQHLMVGRVARFEGMRFRMGDLVGFGVPGDRVREVVRSGSPFMTSGCPDCNRPYYNERPGGPIYNYARPLNNAEISAIEREMALSGLI